MKFGKVDPEVEVERNGEIAESDTVGRTISSVAWFFGVDYEGLGSPSLGHHGQRQSPSEARQRASTVTSKFSDLSAVPWICPADTNQRTAFHFLFMANFPAALWRTKIYPLAQRDHFTACPKRLGASICREFYLMRRLVYMGCGVLSECFDLDTRFCECEDLKTFILSSPTRPDRRSELVDRTREAMFTGSRGYLGIFTSNAESCCAWLT